MAGLVLLAAGALVAALLPARSANKAAQQATPPGRREVIFWHFWGGADRPVVEAVVEQFNRSQQEHFVRAVAMPGNNLDVKFFLAVTGGDPPDLVNQDDPIVADWASRGALLPLDELATPDELRRLDGWLFPAAKALGSYRGRLYALGAGLDIRALYCDTTLLDEAGLAPPRTLAELDTIAERLTHLPQRGLPEQFGYLPDPRRIWAWGIVFGGRFYDPLTGAITADSPPVVAALRWMKSYSDRYGADRAAAFRKGDQALTGAAFPLLQGRYAVIMDGQWRVREILAHQEQARRLGQPVHQYDVVPLPPPPGGKADAGWVNGNFFVVPRGCKNPEGAWAFMKFWSGFSGWEAEAAHTCVEGGWIPASREVVGQDEFQRYLRATPLFARFVALAGSPNQVPVPSIPAASTYYREVIRAAEEAMYRGRDPQQVLEQAADRVRRRLTALEQSTTPAKP